MFSFLRRRSRDHNMNHVPKDKPTKLKSTQVPQVSKPEPGNYIAINDPPKTGTRFKVWDDENVRFCGINLLSDKPYKPKPPKNKVKMRYRSNGDCGPGAYYVTGSGGYSCGGGDGGGGGGGGGGDGGGGGGCGGI